MQLKVGQRDEKSLYKKQRNLMIAEINEEVRTNGIVP